MSKLLYCDQFEYADDAAAQADFVSSDAKFALLLREH